MTNKKHNLLGEKSEATSNVLSTYADAELLDELINT